MKKFFKKIKSKLSKSKSVDELYDDEFEDEFEEELDEEWDEDDDHDEELSADSEEEISEEIDLDNTSPSMALGQGPINLDDVEIEDDEDEETFESQEMNLSDENRHELDEDFDGDEPPPVDIADPDLAEARMAAIQAGEHDDDDFQEHSGINQYREFAVPKDKTKIGKLGALISSFKNKVSAKLPQKNNLDQDQDPVLEFFDPTNRPSIHRAFVTICFVTVTWSAGMILADFVSPKKSNKKKSQVARSIQPSNINTSSIDRANLFNANGPKPKVKPVTKPKVEKKEPPKVCFQAKNQSNTGIVMEKSIVLQNKKKSLVAVRIPGQKGFQNLREGDVVPGLAEVFRITRDKMFIRNLKSKECEFVAMDQKNQPKKPMTARVHSPRAGQKFMQKPKGAITKDGNKIKIPKQVLKDTLGGGNITEVLSQAKAIQIKNPDGTLCFKITQIVPGSVYTKLDIQNNDVICKIDGEEIRSLNVVMNKFGSITEMDQISLGFGQGGNTTTKEYVFE